VYVQLFVSCRVSWKSCITSRLVEIWLFQLTRHDTNSCTYIEKKSYIYYVIMFNVNEYCYCNGLFSYTDIDMTVEDTSHNLLHNLFCHNGLGNLPRLHYILITSDYLGSINNFCSNISLCTEFSSTVNVYVLL
jgi:hypothetical protein